MPMVRGTTGSDVLARTAIWLPRKMISQLRRIGGARGVSEEIRRRLDESFRPDEKTAELIRFIVEVADELKVDGDWTANRKLHAVLVETLKDYLAVHRPEQTAPSEAPHFPGDVQSEAIGLSKLAERLARRP